MTIDKLIECKTTTMATTSVFRSLENLASSGSRICLFGKPDPAVTDAMIRQQYEIDRRRFLDKWAIDLEECRAREQTAATPTKKVAKKPRHRGSPSTRRSDDKENTGDVVTLPEGYFRHRKNSTGRGRNWNKENQRPDRGSPRKSLKMNGEKSYTKNARQSQLTDYWNYRKLSESSCSDREN